jgi:hypothetical protein
MITFKLFLEKVTKPTGGLKKACWSGYTAVGTKQKNGRTVPNCVPEEVEQMYESPKEGGKKKFSGMYNPAPKGTFAYDQAMRKKKHAEIEKQQSKDGSGMSSAVDRLQKHMNKEETELDEMDQKFVDSLNKLSHTHKVGDSVTVDSKFFGKQKGKVTKVDNQSIHVQRDGKKFSEKYPHDAVVKEEVTQIGEMEELFDILEEVVDGIAEENNLDPDVLWENLEDVSDEELYETAAWRRKEGKSASGGLNAKGIASYRRENPGSKLKKAVTGKVKPGSKAAKRRKSFCARMGGMKGAMKKPNGEPTRKALALRKWKCR